MAELDDGLRVGMLFRDRDWRMEDRHGTVIELTPERARLEWNNGRRTWVRRSNLVGRRFARIVD